MMVTAALFAALCLSAAPARSNQAQDNQAQGNQAQGNQTQGTNTKPLNVLILNSWHPAMPWQTAVERGLRKRLAQGGTKAKIYVEYLDAGNFSGERLAEINHDYLSEKYKDRPLDLIVAESGPAATFLQAHPGLLPDVERFFINPGPIVGQSVQAVVDTQQAVDEMLRLAEPRNVFVIADTSSVTGKNRVAATKAALEKADRPIQVEYLLDLPMGTLLETVSALPPDSAIYYALIFRDGEGTRFVPYKAVELIAARANAPVFSAWETLMGSGIVGGSLLSGEAVGEVAGDFINAWQGNGSTNPGSGEIQRVIYDQRQLDRWNFDRSALPLDAEIRFAAPSLWEKHRWTIIGVAIAMALLVILAAALKLSNRRLSIATAKLTEERSLLEQRVADRTAELEARTGALTRSNSELQNFGRAISHDLRNPLGAVAGFLQLLEHTAGKKLDVADRQLIERALEGLGTATGMINGLLDYSRVADATAPAGSVSTEAVVSTAQANLEKLIEETGTEILCGSLPPVRGNETQILRLFQNLIENAIKYRAGDRTPSIRITGTADGATCHFHVADNGVGMAEEDHARIFDLFSRVDPREGLDGVGLGLAECKRIAEQHGGGIRVESKPGIGSTFHISLPAATEPGAKSVALSGTNGPAAARCATGGTKSPDAPRPAAISASDRHGPEPRTALRSC